MLIHAELSWYLPIMWTGHPVLLESFDGKFDGSKTLKEMSGESKWDRSGLSADLWVTGEGVRVGYKRRSHKFINKFRKMFSQLVTSEKIQEVWGNIEDRNHCWLFVISHKSTISTDLWAQEYAGKPFSLNYRFKSCCIFDSFPSFLEIKFEFSFYIINNLQVSHKLLQMCSYISAVSMRMSLDNQHHLLSSSSNCEEIWDAFQQAYVNRDPCQVPMQAYDPLIAVASFKPSCNRVNAYNSLNLVRSEQTRVTIQGKHV